MNNMRRCNICGEVKPLTDFYRDRSASGGRLYRCKECDKAKGIKWARESGYDRKSFRRNKGNPKRQAKNAVKYAVEHGRLPRVSTCKCADCGAQADHYHHESYKKPHWLKVVPLCIRCHRERHSSASLATHWTASPHFGDQ